MSYFNEPFIFNPPPVSSSESFGYVPNIYTPTDKPQNYQSICINMKNLQIIDMKPHMTGIQICKIQTDLIIFIIELLMHKIEDIK